MATPKKNDELERIIKNNRKTSAFKKRFDVISSAVTTAAGSPYASLTAFLVILAWALTGPLFDFSDTWQLIINTSTTIVTFLMVFIIQQSQNKDTRAIQLKLNELIACNEKASNRLIDIEDLTEDELLVLKKFYVKLAELAQKDKNLHATHSIDEATEIHDKKKAVKTK